MSRARMQLRHELPDTINRMAHLNQLITKRRLHARTLLGLASANMFAAGSLQPVQNVEDFIFTILVCTV